MSLRLQTLGIPSYPLAVPYLVALIALFALSYRSPRPRVIQETLASMGRALSVKSNTVKPAAAMDASKP